MPDKQDSVKEGLNTGLRIDPKVTRDDSAEAPLRLEIQEINGEVVRLVQEVQAPSKVDRIVTFRERPAHLKGSRNTRGEAGEWGHAHRGSTKWILAMGVSVLFLVVSGMILLPKINASNAPRKGPESAAMPTESDELKPANTELDRLLTRQSEAIQIYRAFAHASQPEQVVPLIRDGESLIATLAKHWQAMEIPADWSPSTSSNWTARVIAGRVSALLEGFHPDGSGFKAYFTTDHDQLQLDWKATTGHGTATFDQLKSNQGDPSEIRGNISFSDYYTNLFPESSYQSYRFVSPDDEITLWCYAARNSEADESVRSQLQGGAIIQEAPRATRVTLRLKRAPDEALPNQWMIGELIHTDWLSP